MFFVRVIAVIGCALLFSCEPPEYLSEQELSTYVLDEHHDLSKSVAVNTIKIQAIFRPTDLMVAQELKGLPGASDDDIKRLRNKYQPYYYFIVSFSNSGKDVLSNSSSDFSGFSEMLQTISFRMADVVNLTTSKQDTVPVADFVYNRTFGLSNSTDVLVVFDKSKTDKAEWVQINLKEFGLGIGKHSLRFNVTSLDKAPRIFK
jgi:hypothetical protein